MLKAKQERKKVNGVATSAVAVLRVRLTRIKFQFPLSFSIIENGKALQTSAITSFAHNRRFSVLDLECVTGIARTSPGSDFFHKTKFGCLTVNGSGVNCPNVNMPIEAAFDEANCKCLQQSFESAGLHGLMSFDGATIFGRSNNFEQLEFLSETPPVRNCSKSRNKL